MATTRERAAALNTEQVVNVPIGIGTFDPPFCIHEE
jgi:hypothetical protein